MVMEFGRKRGNPNSGFIGNEGHKKSKQEMESFASTGIGRKSKPCMKFFSTSGCSFGDGCHFLHYVPGGFSAVAQMTNLGGNPIPPVRNGMAPPPPFSDGPAPTAKTKLCNKFNTAEGCKFGDKCRFAHGEWELGKPNIPTYEDPRSMGSMGTRLTGRVEPHQPNLAAAANFGASATAKISIDASLGGAIIGKGGVNSKQICRLTGVKLSIKEHDADPNQKNIELEGTFDQIKQASAMVRDLIMNVGAVNRPTKPTHAAAPASNNYKCVKVLQKAPALLVKDAILHMELASCANRLFNYFICAKSFNIYGNIIILLWDSTSFRRKLMINVVEFLGCLI